MKKLFDRFMKGLDKKIRYLCTAVSFVALFPTIIYMLVNMIMGNAANTISSAVVLYILIHVNKSLRG